MHQLNVTGCSYKHKLEEREITKTFKMFERGFSENLMIMGVWGHLAFDPQPSLGVSLLGAE